MGIVTVQLGQCGNQLGCALFQSLAAEFSANDHGSLAVGEFFRPLASFDEGRRDTKPYVARAVLIDMEPKVVNAARATATSADSWWCYSPTGALCRQSGSGNNWAQGFHGYGPQVREDALDLVRREVEACDMLNGFSLLQSMAGGTGAGFGTYIAQALRDEYQSSYIVNNCVWPYESGEVIVQPYNTLLTLSHLADLSDGVVIMENEALHRVCNKLYNIQRPSFADMNSIAARALSSVLLPSVHRSASTMVPQQYGGGSPGAGSGHHPHHHGPASAGLRRTGSGTGLGSGGKAAVVHGGFGDALSDVSARLASVGLAAHPSTTTSSSSRTPSSAQHLQRSTSHAAASTSGQAHHQGPQLMGGGSGGGLGPVNVLGDVVTHLCTHPAHRLLTLRAIPQVPASSIDFTTFTWQGITKRLRQMLITGSILEEGMDWQVTTGAGSGRSPGYGGGGGGGGGGGSSLNLNKSLAAWLVLRGQAASEVDVSEFADPAMYVPWAVQPCMVSSSPHRHARCAMSASLLSNDQHPVGPTGRMLVKAYDMLAARAYCHQYEKYGLGTDEFHQCLAHVEEIVQRYSTL